MLVRTRLQTVVHAAAGGTGRKAENGAVSGLAEPPSRYFKSKPRVWDEPADSSLGGDTRRVLSPAIMNLRPQLPVIELAHAVHELLT
jgi:hypothetical protein